MNNGLERAANRERLNNLGKLKFNNGYKIVKPPNNKKH